MRWDELTGRGRIDWTGWLPIALLIRFGKHNFGEQLVQKLTTFGKWLRPPMGRCKTRYIFWKKNKSIAFDHTNDGKLNLPTKAFSEIKFTLGGVRPVIQLRPSGLDTFRVKSFLERISQLPRDFPKIV